MNFHLLYRSLVFAGVLSFAAVSLSAKDGVSASPDRSLSPVDFVEIPRLKSPQLSPDGTKIIIRRASADWTANKHVHDYILFDLANETQIEIPRWKKKDPSLSEVAWTPDSKSFVTVLERKGDDGKAAYLYSLESLKLEKLFGHSEDVDDVVWSDNGAQLYFRAEREDKRSKLEKRSAIKPYDVKTPDELWRYDMVSATKERLLAGPYSVREYSLADDGRHILHARRPEGAGFASHHDELWLLDLKDNTETQLTKNKYDEADAKLSPDSSRFAFIATVNESGEGYYEDNLFVQDVGSDKPKLILPDQPMEIVDFDWSQGGKALFILGNTGVRTSVFRFDLTNQN